MCELTYRGGYTLDANRCAKWYEARAKVLFEEYDRTGKWIYKDEAREYLRLAANIRKGVKA